MDLSDKTEQSLNQRVWNKIKSISSLRTRPKATLHLSDRVKAELEQAVLDRESQRYPEALKKIETIIIEDPNIPMAAFLKALILWEGYRDSYTAKLGLQRVMELVPNKNNPLYQMAVELFDKIDQSRKTTERTKRI